MGFDISLWIMEKLRQYKKTRMKLFFYIFLIIAFFNKCDQGKLNNKATVEKYYMARDAADFKDISLLVSDTITVVEGDYVMPYTLESYYEVFKWDSVFQTKYKIIELEEVESQVIVSVTLSSIRNAFLQNNPMTCKFKLSLQSGKISKIESLNCKDANWEIWQKRVDALVKWVDINHPELNGFIHDMTMNGAKNYLKAINLYNLSENNY